MPAVAVNQRLLLTIVGEYFGQTTMTSFLYKVAEVTNPQTDAELATSLNDVVKAPLGLVTKYRACCPADGIWLGRELWFQIIGPTRFRKQAFALTDDGTFDAGSNTANVQGSITRVGAFGNRKNTGGIRVPIGSNSCTEGLLGADILASLGVLAVQMVQTLQSGFGVNLKPQVGIPGRTKGPPPVQRSVMESIDLEGAFVQDTARVLRRRTLRVGI